MSLKTETITKTSRFWNDVNRLAKEAFPPKEYLSPADTLELAKIVNLDFLALVDGEKFAGYMVVQTYKNLAYLFFLAVDGKCRSKGYGSEAIRLFKEKYPAKNHAVDIEMMEENAPNVAQRKSRRNFYLRNGFKVTGLFLNYLGENYEVLSLEDDFDKAGFKEMMGTIELDGFKSEFFEK